MRCFLLLLSLMLCSYGCKKEIFFYDSICRPYISSSIVPGNNQATLYFQFYLSDNFSGNCSVDEAITYVVYQSEKENDPMTEVAEGITVDSFVVKNLKNNQPCYFKITARVGRNDAISSEILTTTT